jgi:hypothetical protein
MVAGALLVRCNKGKLRVMTSERSPIIRAAFHEQAAICRAVGSSFTGDVLDTLAEVLDETTRTGAKVLGWAGDPMRDALKLRLTGGVHALARSGEDAALSTLYSDRTGDMGAILRGVLAEYDGWLLPWLDSAPQTNEVGRSGALWPGVMRVAARHGPKIELLELGASAGLNLNMDGFVYDLGGAVAGDPSSDVRLAPRWSGGAPDIAQVEVVARRGVDLNPLDVSDPAVASRLLAYVWPDQPERLARIEVAISIAQLHPPVIDRADGAEWTVEQLSRPQAAGVTRIVYHSIALLYFPDAGRKAVIDTIRAAGQRATPERPLAWLSVEFAAEVKDTALLRMTSWPGHGATETLAHVHPHGAAIEWLV